MENNQSFNTVNDKLNINYITKNQNYSLLSRLNVPFTSNTMSILVYEIVKLSEKFPDFHIINIKHSQGRKSKVINIPK